MNFHEDDGASQSGSGGHGTNEWLDKIRALKLPREVLELKLADALCQIDSLECQLAVHGPSTHKALVDGINELALLVLAEKTNKSDPTEEM